MVASVPSGSVITLSAKVTSGAVAVMVGQVQFCDAVASNCSDIYLLGTVPLTAAGTAVLKFIPGVGNHNYRAIFMGTVNGSSKFSKSVSAAEPLSVVEILPSTTTISATGTSGNYTMASTVTASGSVAPVAGSVSFLDTSNGNNSIATVSLVSGTPVLGFLNSSNPPAGDSAWSMTTGDFNGDGIPDLAVANYGDGTVSILLGKGDGTFTPAVGSPFAVTFDPLAIVAADFNGDGKADLAMENGYYNGVVSVFLGNGDGTFTPAPNSPITVGGAFDTPGATAVGDFNGDGIPDLIATNSNNVISQPGTMTVLLGKGDGTFTPTASSPVAVGAGPISIAVGDFNDDGILDLAVANFAGNNVSILLGNGDGTFMPAANSPIQVGSFPTSVTTGDFNGDGILDLAIANSEYTSSSTGSVTVLLGNGDGTFTPAEKSPITVGGDPQCVAVGDFNGDGKEDLAVANNGGDTVTILLGNGDGTFTSSTTSPIPVGDFPQSEAVADFSGDGFSDLAVANSGSATNTVLLSQLTQTSNALTTGVSIPGSGSHLIQAKYGGNAAYQGSTSSTISLTATGFSISGTNVSVNVGESGSAIITVAPSGGFVGQVALTAAITSSPSGAQDLPTLTFGSTGSVTVTSTASATATLTISTTPATSTTVTYRTSPIIPWYIACGTALALILLLNFSARARECRATLPLLVFLVTLTGVACGGNNNQPAPANPGTTPGTYIVTITATSGSVVATSTITLTVP
ncbi:MAG: VCBS repeat-containing protein [Candidatus Acidiferrales bacterium]